MYVQAYMVGGIYCNIYAIYTVMKCIYLVMYVSSVYLGSDSSSGTKASEDHISKRSRHIHTHT